MRVTTIAQEAVARGYECHFVGEIIELTWVDDYVRALGFKSLSQNIPDTGTTFHNEILVLDSYTIAIDSPFIDPNAWKLVVCITDQFTPNYAADIYVNQSMLMVPNLSSKFVLDGPDFALIRKSIKKVIEYKTSESRPTILIMGGGSDPYGFVKAALQNLNSSGLLFVAHVFSNENLNEFSNLNILQHPLGPELDAFADNIDLVITTAGSSSIEFIAREIPTLIACAVDNQEKLYSQLSELGLAIPIGQRNSEGNWHLDSETMEKVIEDQEIRLSLRRRVQGYIDLLGPSRILDEIEVRIAKREFRN
jgi:spore coat polysaccharide biosynthesis predicted glycosyltransferase SpsG